MLKFASKDTNITNDDGTSQRSEFTESDDDLLDTTKIEVAQKPKDISKMHTSENAKMKRAKFVRKAAVIFNEDDDDLTE